MTVQRQIDRLITQRAAEWVETLKSGGERERAAFVDWLRESRRHMAEYLTLVALDRELDHMDLKSRCDLQNILKSISPRILELNRRGAAATERKPLRLRTWLRPAAIAAGMAIAALALLFSHGAWRHLDFITSVGEQRSIALADGSLVQLNAQSRLRVRLSDAARDLDLLSGEALFDVARDTNRPFRVHTRDAIVQALGTQFNVYARPGKTTVSVLEGKVRIVRSAGESPDREALAAGEQASIEPTGKIERNAHPNVAAAVAWRQRRLIFQKTALGEVVQEFNRYNATPQLRVEGVNPHSRHYSATFDANDPQSFVDFLVHEQDLSVEKRGDEIVIRAR